MATITLDPSELDAGNEISPQVTEQMKEISQVSSDGTLSIQGKTFQISPSLAHAFFEVMQALARGNQVNIDTEDEQLTTTEAADLLNVSRPHLVKLLKQGAIPFHTVGSHRRVYRSDVLIYKKAQRQTAEEAMQRLTKQAQERNMGY